MADPFHADPKNWSRGPIKFYFAHDDPRFWVPKRLPGLGWTINFAHQWAGPAFLALLLLPVLFAAFARVHHG